MSETVNIETLHQGIKCVQNLRFSVGEVFRKLSDGLKGPPENEAKEQDFLHDIHQSLVVVKSHLRDISQFSNDLPERGPQMSLGNTGLLNQDPVHDRAPLYGQLLHTYKWSDKLHEYAGVASSILSSNTLKRSTTMSSIATKRLRRPGPTIHAVPQHNVDSLVSSLALLFPQEMTVQLIRPMGSSAILKITLGQTLRAVVVLRSLIIEWVVVKAISEDHHVDDHKPETVWSSSRYKVFQKVTDHANSAMLHFYSPNMPELAVKSFMVNHVPAIAAILLRLLNETWFRSYNTLFSHPCQRCGRLLSDNLPPTWRDFRNTTAYHENCRQ